MLTIFTTAKHFKGADGRNQVAAIRSWLRSRVVSEIIVYGHASGASEFCAANGVTYIEDIPTNQWGTPFMDGMYKHAHKSCRTPWLGFMNCDLILPPEFDEAIVALAANSHKKILAVGSRRSFDWQPDFSDSPSGVRTIQEFARRFGSSSWPYGTDYFFHPARYRIGFPNFTVGRPYWDNWLVFHGLSRGWTTVDLTQSFEPLHPNHDYNHVRDSTGHKWNGPEGDRNARILFKQSHGVNFNLGDLNLDLVNGEIIKRHSAIGNWLASGSRLTRAIARSKLGYLTPFSRRIENLVDTILYRLRAMGALTCIAKRMVSDYVLGAKKPLVRGQVGHVLFVTHTSCLYGANRSMLYVARILRARNYGVSFLVPSNGPLCSELRVMGVPYLLSPVPYGFSVSRRRRRQRLIVSLAVSYELTRVAAVRKADVIYSNSSVTNLGALLGLVSGKPHVWHLRENPIAQFSMTPDWGWRFQSWLLGRSWKVLVGSSYIRHFFSSKVPHLTYHIAANIAFTDAEVEQFVRENNRSIRCLRFAIVGRFDKAKNIDCAIGGFAEAAQSLPDITLTIYGDGVEEAQDKLQVMVSRSQCGDRIRFQKFKLDRQAMYSEIDCLIVAAHAEAFGRTVVEAMCLGIPVIGCRSGGIAELITPELTGLTFAPGNQSEIAGQVRRFSEDSALYKKVSGEAAAWAKRRFLMSSLEDTYLSIFTGWSAARNCSAPVIAETGLNERCDASADNN